VGERRERSRLSDWAHRRGIARELNACYGPRGWETAYVETALPSPLLARYAARSWDSRVTAIERVGLLRRRWHLRYDTRTVKVSEGRRG
jgi:hypothetical protein